MSLLETRGVTKRFGGLVANLDINFRLEQGELVGLIGPNGAGKTTFFNCITGFYPPDEGRVFFKGRDITGWPPERVCRAGIARTFQVVKTFRDMTVLENVMVGAFLRHPDPGAARARAEEVLEMTDLSPLADTVAGGLPIAYRKRLELARALATDPDVLFLDEAMAGLNPSEIQEAVTMVRRLWEQGLTIVLVEHVMEVVMPLAQRVVVLDYGQVIADDVPEKVARDPRVIEAYLGERFARQVGGEGKTDGARRGERDDTQGTS